jgi:hypothetical protein
MTSETFKSLFRNNFAWKDDGWIPEGHPYEDYPTDMGNGVVWERRSDVTWKYLNDDYFVWEFDETWARTFEFERGDDFFTIMSNIGDIWWWCQSADRCATELGTYEIGQGVPGSIDYYNDARATKD